MFIGIGHKRGDVVGMTSSKITEAVEVEVEDDDACAETGGDLGGVGAGRRRRRDDNRGGSTPGNPLRRISRVPPSAAPDIRACLDGHSTGNLAHGVRSGSRPAAERTVLVGDGGAPEARTASVSSRLAAKWK